MGQEFVVPSFNTNRYYNRNTDSIMTLPTGATAGSVLFVGADGTVDQDNANFYFNDTTNALLLGSSTTPGTAYGATGTSFEINKSAANAQASFNTWSADGSGGILDFRKSRSATIGTQSIVSSGDDLGRVTFRGSDGTAFILGAEILAESDGTPGTNDMPGRLVFSTTADGASGVTERMRIDSLGRIQQQVGGAAAQALTGSTFVVAKSQTGITTVGSGRYFSLQNTSGSVNQVVEIGFGYMAGGVNQPVLIGHKVSSDTAFTKGSLYMAVRDVTTDTAPTEVWTLDSTGQVTQNMPAAASTAETLHTWTVSDDAIGKVQILNLSTTNAVFASAIQGSSASTTQGFAVRGLITTDTGTNAALSFVAATTGLSALATRPLFVWNNAGTTVMQTSATGNLTITNTVNNEGLTINTVSATSTLTLARTTSSAQAWQFAGNNTNFRFRNETAGTDFMTVLPDGSVTNTITATAATAETLHTWTVSDDAVASLRIVNNTTTNSLFIPVIRATGSGTSEALFIRAHITTDTGTSPGIRFDARVSSSTDVATRPLFDWTNNGTQRMVMAANGAITHTILAAASTAETLSTWKMSDDATAKLEILNGSASDATFIPMIKGTSISNNFGLQLVGATTTDSGTSAPFQLIGQTAAGAQVATRAVLDIKNLTTVIATFGGTTSGNAFTTAGGRIQALRNVASTTITVATTDHIVLSTTGGGAVAVSLPASPETGRTYTIKDGVGDANVNNITVTPAAGNIDGAGTKVINTAYGFLVLVYNGTQWNVVGS